MTPPAPTPAADPTEKVEVVRLSSRARAARAMQALKLEHELEALRQDFEERTAPLRRQVEVLKAAALSGKESRRLALTAEPDYPSRTMRFVYQRGRRKLVAASRPLTAAELNQDLFSIQDAP